jgi:hypothetical protein
VAVERLEQTLCSATVAKGLTDLLDAALECGLTDELARPGVLDQFLL